MVGGGNFTSNFKNMNKDKIINDFEKEYPEYAKCNYGTLSKFYDYLISGAVDTVVEEEDFDKYIKPMPTVEYKLTIGKIEKIERGASGEGQP